MRHIDRRQLAAVLTPYQRPSTGRSLFELAATVAPLLALWVAVYLSAAHGWWWGVALSVPAGMFLVRLFMIQHDCGHLSFFANAAANRWIGRAIGVVTMTPFEYWRRTHAIHHATSGNLDRRRLGAIETMTTAEYRASPPHRRLAYRLYRHPLILLGVGPSYMFLLQHRLPVGAFREAWAWRSVLGTNVVLAIASAVLIALAGPVAVAVAHLSVMVVAATIGVWLFYVQHQFEESYWARDVEWDPAQAALAGCSHLHLPPPLAWLTAHIGAHHIHHASTRVPFYRLPQVLKSEPIFRNAPVVRPSQSLRLLGLALWDEGNQRLISFRAARGSRGQDGMGGRAAGGCVAGAAAGDVTDQPPRW